MQNPHSIVHYGIDDQQQSIANAVKNGQWVSAANNTKWSELITFMQKHQIEKPWGHKKIIDHSARFKNLLVKIGLEFEQREDVIRIWGYLPKDETDFPPQTNFVQPHHIFSDTWK